MWCRTIRESQQRCWLKYASGWKKKYVADLISGCVDCSVWATQHVTLPPTSSPPPSPSPPPPCTLVVSQVRASCTGQEVMDQVDCTKSLNLFLLQPSPSAFLQPQVGTVFYGSYYSQSAHGTFSYTIIYDTSINQTDYGAMVGYFNATQSNSTFKVRLWVDVFSIYVCVGLGANCIASCAYN